jgi:hypothetical protein
VRGLTGRLFFILFILLLSFRQGLGLYVDWLWFAEVGYTQVFTTSRVTSSRWPLFPGFLSPLSFISTSRSPPRCQAALPFHCRQCHRASPAELVDPLLRQMLLPAALIIQSYAKTFPNLLKPMSAMPEDLREHIRYPQDLFSIQAHLYATYHMQDAQVFYNKEDLLSIPRRTVEGREREMERYYTIMRLPGEAKEEFVLLLPFTPNKRDNMQAWLAARSDPPHYGKLTALEFPKAKLVYGPKQIDASIDQDTLISQQLSLWNQRGSQVIRGSLLAIPIEKSLLYVQLLYLAAEQGSLPELKRVIAAFGSQIAMEETLDQSLQKIFGAKPAREATTPAAPVATANGGRDLAHQVLDHFQRSQERLRQGNWGGYGEELKKLETLLRQMQPGR